MAAGSSGSGPSGRESPFLSSRLAGGAGLGLAIAYLSVAVLIPLAAVVDQAFSQSFGDLWAAISSAETVKALWVTIAISLVTAAVSAVMGTLVAWVLVRDRFRGQAIVNALIDLPFAIPTIVAGLTLLVLYGASSPFGINIDATRGIVLIALLFVTLPFVVRAVQPVLLELDPEAEEAAASLGASNATIFRRIILPSLRPAILSGAALSFARSIGEIGTLLLVAGKVPIASIVIFDDFEGNEIRVASSVSLVLMVIALALLVGIRRLGGRVAH